jgi:hypothetical protein
VRANGTTTAFEKVGPSDSQRQLDLRAAGAGYWVPENIDPNVSPPAWTVEVNLPEAMRAGPLSLEFRSSSSGQESPPLIVNVIQDMRAIAAGPKRVDLDWRDRGNELVYHLQRSVDGGPYSGLVSIVPDATSYTDAQTRGNRRYSYRLRADCPAPPGVTGLGSSTSEVEVTTPKETGTDEISFFRSNDPLDDQFVYKNPLSLFDPDDALITNVTNISEDENGNGVKLELVGHTDTTVGLRSLGAANCPTAPLEPQSSTSEYNGQTVTGEWKVRAVCISQTFLDDPPARIALRIAWTQ